MTWTRSPSSLLFILVAMHLGCDAADAPVARDIGHGPSASADAATPEAKIQRALVGDVEGQWERVLWVGIAIGEGMGMDLSQLSELAEPIPPDLRTHFYDGVAHGLDWPSDDMAACVAAIQQVPAQMQRSMWQGPIQHLVMRFDGDPDQVMPRLDAVPLAWRIEVQNGVRIGLMRVYKHRLPDAVPVILRYPTSYQAELFEEWGWWIGERIGPDASRARALIDEVPEDLRGSAYHGFVRGVDLRGDLQGHLTLFESLDPAYRESYLGALEWKIEHWYRLEPEKRQAALLAIRQALESPD